MKPPAGWPSLNNIPIARIEYSEEGRRIQAERFAFASDSLPKSQPKWAPIASYTQGSTAETLRSGSGRCAILQNCFVVFPSRAFSRAPLSTFRFAFNGREDIV